MSITLDELAIADDPKAWSAAGFDVHGDAVDVGSVRLVLLGEGEKRGIVGWNLGGVPDGRDSVDGVRCLRPHEHSAPRKPSGASASGRSPHPNGVVAIDHVVLASPHLERTEESMRDLGVEPRRVRDAELNGSAIRQVFYRLGGVIVEVVGSPDATGDGPSSLWGITFTVEDLDATAAHFGERTSPVKDAVQPGRRITTLRHRDLGLSVRTALISAPLR